MTQQRSTPAVTVHQTIICLIFIITTQPTYSWADVDSGCPSYGCLPWGSFSLSAGVPAQNCTIPWRVELETLAASDADSSVPRGCVSDQQTVVCTTQSGYISVDPTNGKKLWSYSTMASPYLPIMDIYGDVIGMDSEALYYVGADGKPKKPITIGSFKPQHSLMISNNSIMLITGSTKETAQILTYDTDGVVDGAFQLKAWVENMNGTFIPCSQPIIAGFRAYVMTYFLPDNPDAKEAQGTTGMLRLYALDLLQQLAPRIREAWHYSFGPWVRLPANYMNSKSSYSTPNQRLDPIVTYYDNVVYVNVPRTPTEHFESRSSRQTQPYQGALWAIRDNGTEGTHLFGASTVYGPMAVYDTYFNPLSTKNTQEEESNNQNEDHTLWIVNKSPAMIHGYSTRNGTMKNIKGLQDIFEKVGVVITSSLSITRSTTSPNNDQLVFGTTDQSGQAVISVVEIDENNEAKLVLSRVVSKPTLSPKGDERGYVEGQIVNFAFYPPIVGIRSGEPKRVKNGEKTTRKIKMEKDDTDQWKLGLAAIVNESNSTTVTRTVVGVF